MRLEADAKVAEAAYGRDERGDREEQRDAGEADERLLDEVVVAVRILEDPEDLVREVADGLDVSVTDRARRTMIMSTMNATAMGLLSLRIAKKPKMRMRPVMGTAARVR